jgi:prepilin-type N-terminal cleavage/methylation domain-containing protein
MEIKRIGINAAPTGTQIRDETADAIKTCRMLSELNKNRGGFSLVEIMIVVAIISLLAGLAIPGFLRARKRVQASRVLTDLRLIVSAVDQYAIENSRATGSVVPVAAWTAYMKQGSLLYNTGQDMFGQDYGQQTVDSLPKVPLVTWNTLSDVAGTTYFSPYGP